MNDLSSYRTTSTTDHNGLVHTWRVSRCQLITNLNQFDQKLTEVKSDTVGVLVTYKNPYTSRTSWTVVFEKDKWNIMDEAVLERYIKKL